MNFYADLNLKSIVYSDSLSFYENLHSRSIRYSMSFHWEKISDNFLKCSYFSEALLGIFPTPTGLDVWFLLGYYANGTKVVNLREFSDLIIRLSSALKSLCENTSYSK